MKAPTLRHRAATICEDAKVEGPAATHTVQHGCKHYWDIDRATAQVSRGTCKLCGARKQFPNYLSDCIAGPDADRYQEWLSKQEWQDMLATPDSAIVLEVGGVSHYSVHEGRPKVAAKGL
jgi:hypothetical protein